MLHSSEGPGEYCNVKYLFLKGDVFCARPRKMDMSVQIHRAVRAGDAQGVVIGIECHNPFRRPRILECQTSLAASDFKHALILKISECMQDCLLNAFGIFLYGHVFSLAGRHFEMCLPAVCYFADCFMAFTDSLTSSSKTCLSTSASLLMYRQETPVECLPSFFNRSL